MCSDRWSDTAIIIMLNKIWLSLLLAILTNLSNSSNKKGLCVQKKEITKSNILTFSTWYDIKPVVVMPKMKIKFKKMQICVIK